VKPSDKLAAVALWLSGGAGSRSSIHHDPFHNLLVVLAGAKRVTLWAPSQTAALYPMARSHTHFFAMRTQHGCC
jgi:hypothetical protein